MSATMKSPVKTVGINARDVITLTARLAQILAQEVDLLQAMKIKEIDRLQEEKLFLIEALETHKKILRRHPELSETIPSQDKRDLEDVLHVFNDVLEENNRRLQVAKEINQQVVKAIRVVAAEHAETPYYGGNGLRNTSPYELMSVTLNQTV